MRWADARSSSRPPMAIVADEDGPIARPRRHRVQCRVELAHAALRLPLRRRAGHRARANHASTAAPGERARFPRRFRRSSTPRASTSTRSTSRTPPTHAGSQACCWPDQIDRFERLAAAIDLARRHPPHVRRGDALGLIGELVHDASPSGHPVVTTSWVLNYLVADRRRSFVEHLDATRTRHRLQLGDRRITGTDT